MVAACQTWVQLPQVQRVSTKLNGEHEQFCRFLERAVSPYPVGVIFQVLEFAVRVVRARHGKRLGRTRWATCRSAFRSSWADKCP